MKPPATYNAHETSRMHALHRRELASFRRRACAFLIDFTLGALLFLALMIGVIALLTGKLPLGHLKFHAGLEHGETPPGTYQLNFFKNGLSVVWWVLYFGLLTWLGRGQTPGKRLMKIRVVSTVHEKLSLWHSLERAFGYGASTLEFGFGFLQYFIDPNRRTTHDRIAETIVLVEPPKPAPVKKAPAPAKPAEEKTEAPQ